MSRYYEVMIAVPLPDDYFARAEVVAKIKPACEALALGLAKAKIDGLTISSRETTKKAARIVPPEPVSTAPRLVGPMSGNDAA